MGNRGTTPSWDEEEIRKWGFWGHLDNVRRGRKLREHITRCRHEAEMRKLLTLLQALLKSKEQS